MSRFAVIVNIICISIGALGGARIFERGTSDGGHPRNGNIPYNFLKRFGFNTIEGCDCLEEKP